MISRLQEETAKVEEQLLSSSDFSAAIVQCFSHSKTDSFENLLEPLQKLLRLSPPVAASLAHPDLFSRTGQKLQSKKALVRLNLLRIIRSICDASEEDGGLITRYGLDVAIMDLARNDQAVLVREMAGDLIKASELSVRRSADGTRRGMMRRSSSSTTPIIPSQGSLPPTPNSDRRSGSRAGSSYFDLDDFVRPLRAIQPNSSPYRPISRDSIDSMSDLTTPNYSSTSTTNAFGSMTKSRLPRTRVTAQRVAQARPSVVTNMKNHDDSPGSVVFSPMSASGLSTSSMSSILPTSPGSKTARQTGTTAPRRRMTSQESL